MLEHGDDVYRNATTGMPVVALRWAGDSTDTGPVERFLARHLHRPGRWRCGVAAATHDLGHQLDHRALRISGPQVSRLDAAAGWWIIIGGVDLPRPDRYLTTINPTRFAGEYRKGLQP